MARRVRIVVGFLEGFLFMVQGGQYGEYPSRKAEDLTQGDLAPNLDFRGLYATILEDWLHVDAQPIVKGSFEKPRFL